MAKVTTDFKAAQKDIAKFKRIAGKLAATELEKQIKESIARGVSPVKGQGRFAPYSKSYIDAMKGKVAFYTKDKKVRKIDIDRSDRELVNFQKQLYGNKRPRPVNLKLSGDLMNSLKVRFAQYAGIAKIIISFDNKLADIHNRIGAGKSKTIRRMLPTNKGEQFSRSINMRVTEVLKRVSKAIFRR